MNVDVPAGGGVRITYDGTLEIILVDGVINANGSPLSADNFTTVSLTPRSALYLYSIEMGRAHLRPSVASASRLAAAPFPPPREVPFAAPPSSSASSSSPLLPVVEPFPSRVGELLLTIRHRLAPTPRARVVCFGPPPNNNNNYKTTITPTSNNQQQHHIAASIIMHTLMRSHSSTAGHQQPPPVYAELDPGVGGASLGSGLPPLCLTAVDTLRELPMIPGTHWGAELAPQSFFFGATSVGEANLAHYLHALSLTSAVAGLMAYERRGAATVFCLPDAGGVVNSGSSSRRSSTSGGSSICDTADPADALLDEVVVGGEDGAAGAAAAETGGDGTTAAAGIQTKRTRRALQQQQQLVNRTIGGPVPTATFVREALLRLQPTHAVAVGFDDDKSGSSNTTNRAILSEIRADLSRTMPGVTLLSVGGLTPPPAAPEAQQQQPRTGTADDDVNEDDDDDDDDGADAAVITSKQRGQKGEFLHPQQGGEEASSYAASLTTLRRYLALHAAGLPSLSQQLIDEYLAGSDSRPLGCSRVLAPLSSLRLFRLTKPPPRRMIRRAKTNTTKDSTNAEEEEEVDGEDGADASSNDEVDGSGDSSSAMMASSSGNLLAQPLAVKPAEVPIGTVLALSQARSTQELPLATIYGLCVLLARDSTHALLLLPSAEASLPSGLLLVGDTTVDYSPALQRVTF